jgi:hypothetical protein
LIASAPPVEVSNIQQLNSEDAMKKILGTLALALAVGLPAAAAPPSQMVCTKTGTVIDSCCCVVREGVMICTLTGMRVDACCCTSAK